MARVARADVNMPKYDGFLLLWLHNQAEFEAAVYHLPEGIAEVPTSRLLYSGRPRQSDRPKTELPKDISGRKAMLIDMRKAKSLLWQDTKKNQKVSVGSPNL